jgi:hypothetical protein
MCLYSFIQSFLVVSAVPVVVGDEGFEAEVVEFLPLFAASWFPIHSEVGELSCVCEEEEEVDERGEAEVDGEETTGREAGDAVLLLWLLLIGDAIVSVLGEFMEVRGVSAVEEDEDGKTGVDELDDDAAFSGFSCDCCC